MGSSFRSRPAPIAWAAEPSAMVFIRETYPSRPQSTVLRTAACGSRLTSSHTAGFPPCAAIISFSFLRPAPLSSACRSIFSAFSSDPAFPASTSICAPRVRETSFRSPAARPERMSIASFTSSALPTWVPSG